MNIWHVFGHTAFAVVGAALGLARAFSAASNSGPTRYWQLLWAGLLVFVALCAAFNLGFEGGQFMGVRGQ